MQLTHLHLRAPQDVADLYRLLGYPVEEDNPALSAQDAFLEGAATRDVRAVYLLVQLEELQHVHVVVADPDTPTVRRVAEQFARKPGQYLLSFADSAHAEVVFVKPHQDGGATKLSKLLVRTRRPTAHDLSVLREITVGLGTSGEEAHRRQVRAFNVERVTRKFYEEYSRLFRHVRNTIEAENPNTKIGPLKKNTTADAGSLHAFTQRLLGRVIFLYFIQKKGWLDNREDFVAELYRSATAREGENFYRDALEPLFFETLNTPRPGNASPFGAVPYLNGSLFEREYPADTVLNLPNSLFDPRAPESILHLLGSYNFTVEESGSLEQDVSLDPEMLGKVFENMMEEEEAKRSGTFYTPRSIVQFMAEETLTRYLADHTNIPQEELLPLCGDDSEVHKLDLQQARSIRDSLAKVRVLDPAVGTASMLVGFLNAMIRVRRSVEAKIINTVVPGGSADVADWKREYIQRCLYGVDIKHEAIEIARLRLWLSLVVDAQEPEPLPNLDYKLMAGDGLLETVDGTPFIKPEQAIIGGQAVVAEKANEIERLHERFFHEKDPRRRLEQRERIQVLERELFKADVDDRIRNLNENLSSLSRQIADQRQGERAREPLLRRYATLSVNLGRLIDQKTKVWDELEPLPFFLHNVHFAEVMKGQGGFDIVIGNPPYVRHERLDKPYKVALATAFDAVATGAADLYVYFYQKGLNLLRNGGRLAYITPNKFLRAGYGEKLRDLLSARTRLEMLVDFGDLPVFDATTYPFIALLQKAVPNGDEVRMLPERTLKTRLGPALEGGVLQIRDALSSFHEYARTLTAPIPAREFGSREWTLDDPRVLRLMEKLRSKGTPLGELVQGKFYRGIVTGFNEAFVIGQEKRDELLAADPKSAEIIKPYLWGRDVKRWRPEWAGLYLIFTRRGVDLERYAAIKAHLSQYRQYLEPGSSGGRKAGSYKWYEIQDNIAYFEEFEKSKVIYQEIATEIKFAHTREAYYLNNKCFFIPDPSPFLAGLLSSQIIKFYLLNLASRLQGGAFALQSIYVEQLPIVTPTRAQAALLESFTDDTHLGELNALVYEMYGLAPDEVELVESLTPGAYAEAGRDEELEAAGAEA